MNWGALVGWIAVEGYISITTYFSIFIYSKSCYYLPFYILTRSLLASPEAAVFQAIPLYLGGVRSILSLMNLFRTCECSNLNGVCNKHGSSVLLDYGL